MKKHPYFISLKEVIDEYTPESLSQLDEEGRDTLFRKFWVNYMERMAKENRYSTYTTESLHLTPPSNKYCEICRLRGMKKRAVLEDKIDDIDYNLCWDCSIEEHICQNLK